MAGNRSTTLQMATEPNSNAKVSKPKASIRARIMILALLLTMPLMLDRMRLLENTRTERIAHTVADVADLARRGSEAQSEIISAARALLRVVARAIALDHGSFDCRAFLSGFATGVPWIQGLSIVGPDNRIACSTRSLAVGIDVSDREYVNQARQTSNFVLSEYLIERANNKPTIMAAYPAPGTGEGASAIILAPVELHWVERFAELIEERKGATAFLVGRNGAVLSQLPGRGPPDGTDIRDHPLIREVTSQNNGTLRMAGLDGVHRIFAFSELPGTDSKIVVGIDEGEALGHIDHDISVAYFQLALFGILATLLTWFGGEHFIIAPVHALARTAAGIGRGNLDVRPDRGGWTSEFAPLAAAMADMARKLSERELELRTANRHLQELALIDGLSGLPNRRAFDARLSSAWLAADPNCSFSLMILDVDHFKLFNDTQGHIEGDNCLRRIGRAIDSVVRQNDFAARYGGEEFIMLLPGVNAAEVLEVAERARREVEALKISHPAAPLGTITISVGVATLTITQAGNEEGLIKAADSALYEAKRRGRNMVTAYLPLESLQSS